MVEKNIIIEILYKLENSEVELYNVLQIWIGEIAFTHKSKFLTKNKLYLEVGLGILQYSQFRLIAATFDFLNGY